MKFAVTLTIVAQAANAAKFFNFDSFFNKAFDDLETNVYKTEKTETNIAGEPTVAPIPGPELGGEPVAVVEPVATGDPDEVAFEGQIGDAKVSVSRKVLSNGMEESEIIC